MKPKQRKSKWRITFFSEVIPSSARQDRDFIFRGTLESALAEADQLECEVPFVVKKLIIVRMHR